MKVRVAVILLVAFSLLTLTFSLSSAQEEQKVRVAFLPIKTASGISHWWSGNFDPGVAMTGLLENKLIDSRRFEVIDRQNLDKIMQEHNLTIAGEVSSDTVARIGEITGAKYLLTGEVIEFSEVDSGGSSGFSVGFGIGVSSSSQGNKKVRVKVVCRLTDTDTSVMTGKAESMKEIPVKSGGGSFYIAGTGGSSSGGETTASGLGKGLEEVASELATKLDSTKITPSVVRKGFTGYIMDIDGDQIMLKLDNAGEIDKIINGTKFTVSRSKSIKDPKTMEIQTIKKPIGELVVTSVDKDTKIIFAKPSNTTDTLQKLDPVTSK